jgi:uncharacterized protein (TIGR02231 family)
MKTIFAYFFLFVLTSSLFAQKQTKTEKISDVTIFLNAAEIKSSASFTLPAGKSTIVIQGISQYMMPQSLVVNPENNLKLASISTEDYALNEETELAGLKPMLDSLNTFTQQINDLNNKLDAFAIEKEMLLDNTHIGGSQTGVSVEVLKNAADFYRQRISAINTETSLIQRDLEKLYNCSTKLNIRIEQLKYSNNLNRKRISIDVLTDQSGTFTINFRYLVYNCGWAASYDITVTDITEPMNLKYKAQILNNSGIEWKDINVVLSTSDPMQGASAPTLTPWYLNYSNGYTQGNNDYRYRQYSNENAPAAAQNVSNQEWSQEYDNVNVSELSTEFVIDGKYTIPSSLQPFRLDVLEYTLNSEYKYVCIPKMEHKVYLLARVTGWEKYELIDGDMNVYYSGSYVGISRLNTYTLNDTLDLSLGRDNKIAVTRTKLENYSKKSLIGGSRKESHMYEISVKNNKNTPIDIEIVDQVPVSQESEIEVFVDDISDADYNEISGIVKWHCNIVPGDKKTYTIAYSVKYPKNKPVMMKKMRSVSCPSF